MQEICFLSVHNTCTVMENDDIFTWKDAPQRGKGGYVVGVRDNRNFQPKGISFYIIYYVSLLCLPTLYH